jgi:Dna[CI] antecedent, DciA
MRHNKNDYSLREALQAMLREYKLEGKYNETRIRALWDQLMGKTIATYTANLTVRKKILYLTIQSAPLRQELSYAKEKIKTLINTEMGEEYIIDVVIR